ncbi:fas apoptotic inhibitory molecule 1-like isoform X1 [Dunckerocampus dactyliophorus]|uniref:fas apoptotic inhibitory molecule 1-like isoform X1 n=1 Tax=Dunckerocampus dactyliophorus TaxID=161453 RepID=UPI002405CB1B|nr:fas apoptotic inhibitory molecule 1-like isoform X1 [Dunckerocampus dactyliophorus]
MLSGDLVASWEVALSDGVYRIEFDHGTTTGRRIVYVNGQEVVRRDWMFKLVGKETFSIGGSHTKATINIQAISGLAYEYTLQVDGKSLQTFMDNKAKSTKTWLLCVDGENWRVVLEKDTMDVWCNGQKTSTTVRKHLPRSSDVQCKPRVSKAGSGRCSLFYWPCGYSKNEIILLLMTYIIRYCLSLIKQSLDVDVFFR